jgi:predicted DNA-binding antitoxin AbrB/MazE fold protein
MSIEAIYQGGVFKPLNQVQLPENQRVWLDVRPSETTDWPAWIREIDQFREELRAKYGEFPDSTRDIAEDRMRDV